MYILVCNNTVLIQIWSMQECMHHVLTAVDSSELVALLEETRLSSEEQAEHADSDQGCRLEDF